MRRFIWLLCVVGLLSGGCATNYFPLKNEAYTKTLTEGKKKAVILPFQVWIQYNPVAINNNQEKAQQKAKQADEFFLQALKESLLEYGFEVTDYLLYSDFEKDLDDFKTERLAISAELIDEFGAAIYGINKNLQEEKGKGFDYTVGIRAQELAQQFDPKPDVFIKVTPNAFVADLSIFESNTLNTINAILSLGMSNLAAGAEDVIMLDISVINAQTGDIIWINTGYFYGKTVLKYEPIKDVINKTLQPIKASAGGKK